MIVSGERGPGGVYELQYDGHTYKFPSVTTIISKYKDPDIESLEDSIGDADKWNEITKNATDRGSVMHMYLENYIRCFAKYESHDNALLYTQKKTPQQFVDMHEPIFNKGRALFYNIYNSDFMSEFKKPILIEGLLVSLEYEYAGKTDLIYYDSNDCIIVGDYKSSSKELNISSMPANKIIKYKLQLAAYIHAFEEMYKKNVKEGVVWVSSENKCQKIVLNKYEYPIYFNFFKELIKK
jgi:CRISPR/Cas system-associated exonuclease Cas4 (RecB family)